ncbi:lipopolysaccharide biosynthesis protein (plasmid) [Haloferax larsenii]|uniref:Lipopolysaccharide biosynthesis protein n=1 Tax=Haloferax larsenii TaxID=302484 RepID=A0ABY5RKD3_HALLR|nr:lipopolysaccharide biosynthesis protein [Haloferax larsenii]ELZ80537.1 export protein [Haloferax larsenii JCM 13917]UVE52480.1 lipopolysaccharide biosynthesis protein [Haloferax larsenii]
MRSLLRRFIPSGAVGERTVKSGLWMTGINVSNRILLMLMVVVLAGLLGPTEFGLMGLALLTVTAMNQFTELGLDASLIQREEEDVDAYLDTVWTIKLIRGIVLFALAYVAAPYLAAFFNEPRATDVFRVIALSPLLVGLRNPRIVYLQKNLEFHKQFVYDVSGTLFHVGVALALGFIFGTVWALVFGTLTGNVVRTFVSYLIDRRLPRLVIERARAIEMIRYGRWITGSGIFMFFFANGDDAFLGWFLGATALGFYQLAYQLARTPSSEVTKVISSVMFPAYSKLQGNLRALRQTYFTVLKLTAVVSMPMAVGIIVVAGPFVHAFLGDEWIPAIPALQILALWGLMLSIGATSGPLLKAIGRPDYITKVNVLKTVALAVLIYPLTDAYGLVGTAAAVVLAGALTSEPLINYIVIREIKGSFIQFFVTVGTPLTASLVMGAAVVATESMLPASGTALGFAVLVVTGVVVYTACMVAVEVTFDYGMRSLVRDIAAKIT